MTRLVLATLALCAALTSGIALAGDRAGTSKGDEAPGVEQPPGDGFEPVDPESLEIVSGARLMVAAYAVIVGAITLYSLLLLLRERATHRAIRRLEQQIHRPRKQ